MNEPRPDTDTLIDQLQSRLAYQENSILELSNEVYRQQQELATLEAKLRRLIDRLEPLEQAQTGVAPTDELPPHY